MRVALTGSSGLIGRSLVGALEARGDEVVVFVRPNSPAGHRAAVRWNPDVGDVNEDDLRRVGNFDAVINLAGAGIGDRRWSSTIRRAILRSRVDATSLLVRVLRDHSGGAHLVNASAIGWYGSRGEERLEETSMAGSGFLADVCQQWERAAAAHAIDGSPTTYLRTGIVLCAEGGSLAKQLPLFKLGLGGPLGGGEQWMSAVTLADHLRAVLWILDHELIGPVNVTSPQPSRNRDFSRAVAATLRRTAFVRVPAVALHLALGREMADELVLASQRVVPTRLSDSGFVFEHDSLEAMVGWAVHGGV